MAYIGKSPTAAPLTSSDVTDGIITEAKMANDAISLAELKAGTDGNIISYDTSGNPVAVATGTDGQVLTSSGAGAVCAFEDAGGGVNTPAFQANVSGQQTISQSTWTKVDYDTEIFDTDSMYDQTTNQRFTPTTAGKYMIGAQMLTTMGGKDWDANDLAIYLNGSLYTKSRYQLESCQTQTSGMNVHAIIDFDGSSDYVEIYTWRYTSAGGNTPYVSAGTSSIFWGYKLIE